MNRHNAVLVALEEVIENYGNPISEELVSVLTKIQIELQHFDQVSDRALHEIRQVLPLARNYKISGALGLKASILVDELMEQHNGIQAEYLDLVSQFICEVMVNGRD